MARSPRLGLPTPTLERRGQREVLRTVKEALEVSQRVRGDPMKSFVRLDELRSLGLTDPNGNLTGPVSIAEENTADHARLRHLAHFRGA